MLFYGPFGHLSDISVLRARLEELGQECESRPAVTAAARPFDAQDVDPSLSSFAEAPARSLRMNIRRMYVSIYIIYIYIYTYFPPLMSTCLLVSMVFECLTKIYSNST